MAPRVVSLVPSVTETLLAWGLRPVAVTRFCEQPDLPAVGGTKNPDVEAIRRLSPDVVVMEKEENRREDAEALEDRGLHVHVLHVRSVADVGPSFDGLAAALGISRSAIAAAVPDAAVPRVRVWVPIWRRPWMSIGGSTYGSSVLDAAGFENVLASREEEYPLLDPGSASRLRPDRVLAPSEPYHFTERHRRDLERAAPVEFVDGRDVFWWGVRTPAAIQRLSALAATVRRGEGLV